jgi:HEAT repeat protein
MKPRSHRFALPVILAAALLPTLGVAFRAVADEPDPDAEAEAPEKTARKNKAPAPEKTRQRVLASMPGDATALINVSARELPASPDILALGRRGTPALARCLADNADDDVRRSCAVMLGFIGDRAALPALHAALDDWERPVRLAVVRALERIPDPSSIDALVKLHGRKDESGDVRAAVLQALGAIGHKKAVGFLRRELVKEPEKGADDQRATAFHALWRSRHVMSRETLVGDVADALGSGHDALVLASVYAAAELRAPRLTGKLVPLLDHGNAEVRNKAVYALGLIGDKTAEKALLAKLPGVRDGRMLNNIAFALERLDRDGFYASIKQVIEHKQAIIRLNAAFVLGDVKRPEGLPLLEKALADPSDLVKTSAAVALGKIGDDKAIPLLEKLVDAPNPSLREEAIFAIFAISGGKRADLLHDKLFGGKREDARKRAALSLGKIGDARVRDYLLTCLEKRQCRASQADAFVHADKDPSVGGRLLLDWSRGRQSFTRFVADLRPAGALPIAVSAAEAAVSGQAIDNAEAAIDLVGELGDAAARARLGRLAGAPAMSDPWLQIHTRTALARLGEQPAEAALLGQMDTIAAVWLPRFAAIVSQIKEKEVRDRLAPELVKREKGSDAAVALSAAAIRLAWDPENAATRLLDALASPEVRERDLAERYLARARDPKVTWLLRRALSRETREDVKDRLRSVLALRHDAR